MMLDLSFPDKPLSEAGILAQKLRAGIAKVGVPLENIQVKRQDAEAMDAGTYLHIALIVFELLALAKAIYEVLFPARAGVRIRGPKGVVEIKASELPGAVNDQLPKSLRQFIMIDAPFKEIRSKERLVTRWHGPCPIKPGKREHKTRGNSPTS